jgi:hypothetical protein
MTHAAVMNSVLPWFMLVMTLLLVLFIWTVIRANVEPADSSAEPTLTVSSPLPATRPPAPASGATAARHHGARHAARRADATARWQDPAHRRQTHTGLPPDPAPAGAAAPDGPEMASGPPWGPAPKPPGRDPWSSRQR